MDTTRVNRVSAVVLEGIVVVAMLVVVVLSVVRPIASPAGLQATSSSLFDFNVVASIPVTLSDVQVRTEPELPDLDGGQFDSFMPGDGLEFYPPTGARVAVFDPDLRQQFGLVGAPVLGGLVTVAVLGLLLLMVRTLRRGDPFIPANGRRLLWIAALVGIGGQAAVLLTAWGRLGILEHPRVAPYVVHDVPISFLPLLAGFGIAILADVFRRGTQLRREVDGLV